ncbi:hypothetical protein ACFXHK_07560 [Embleya sp. NPDC059267]|uniref:hypothetical protein n=1 Tax=unclassified Embleya TaxID=2699296 RepID=UPI0036B30B2D
MPAAARTVAALSVTRYPTTVGTHATEPARAAELLNQAATVINRDPAHAPTPTAGPPLTRAAGTQTITSVAPATDAVVHAHPGPADLQARRAS